MATKLVVGYLANTAAGAPSTVELQLNGSKFSFVPAQAGGGVLSGLSRVDLFASDGTLMAVIPCVAASSSITLGGDLQSCNFALTMRNLLGGADTRVTTSLQWWTWEDTNDNDHSDLYFYAGALPPSPKSPYVGINIGGGCVDTGNAPTENKPFYRYDDNLKQLAVQEPQQAANTPSAFETMTGEPLFSDHVSYRVRPVQCSGGKLPVLVGRRACQVNPRSSDQNHVYLAEPFALVLPVVGDQVTAAHVAQYPAIAWFDGQSDTEPLAEPAAWQFETSALPNGLVNDLWSTRVLQPYIRGLRLIDAPLPLSMLPTLNWTDPGGGVETSWRIVRLASVAAAGGLNLLSYQLLYGGFLDGDSGGATAALAVSCVLPGLRTHDGSALRFSATLVPFAPPLNVTSTSKNPSLLFTLTGLTVTSATTTGSTAPRVRLGSLDLTFGNAFATDPATQDFSCQFQVDFTPPVRMDDPPFNAMPWTPRVFLRGYLPVTRYAPGGQDAPPDVNEFRLTADPGAPADAAKFTRSQPLVIDASLVDGSVAPALLPPAYMLRFDELTLPAPQQQQMVLTLSALAAGGASGDPPQVLVLDREPFLVAFVSLATAANSDDVDDTLVGVWCNLYPEGPGWRLSVGAGGFNLYLPPQAVGEAMVRGMSGYDPGSPQPGSTIDYRFSPVLAARLLASSFAQNAVEPGWNSRRVLGYAGQQAPGALVDSNNGGLQFELLYGLTAKVTQPSLRLSEMFARLGNFPGPLPLLDGPAMTDPQYTAAQRAAYKVAATGWADCYAQLLSRPGVLELWDDHQGADLLLDEGVVYSIRTGALYAEGDRTKLSGGLGYAVESANILKELTAQPVSTAGRLVSPRFTALGGYGTQRAEFANGKVIIDSRTTMGRLESMTVTLVGRIGNLWNHALHVTVYERTVVASEQFAPYQNAMPGRPLLRKTAEFVQITEPLRNYPESGASDPALSGFVSASSFKTTKIFVDSRWGGDVGEIGWQVPLWRQDALPAAVYPTPHIALKVAVDPALGVDGVLNDIADPDKLCFYTDTQTDTTADTETWPMVAEIDWIDQPANTSASAQMQDPSVEIGFGRFTYHFADAPTKVNLVANRTSTAVSATLKNVSMMRGARGAAGTPAGTQVVRRLEDWWTAAQTHLSQVADQAAAYLLNPPSNQTQTPQQVAQQMLTSALNAVQTNYIGYTKPLTPTAPAVPAGVNTLIGDLGQFPARVNRACDAAKASLTAALNRLDSQKQQLVRTLLQQFPALLVQGIDHLVVKDIIQLEAEYTAAVGSEIESLRTMLAPLTGSVQQAISAIDAYSAAVTGPLATAQASVGALITALGNTNAPDVIDAALGPMLPLSGMRSQLADAAAAIDGATSLISGGRGTKLVVAFDGYTDAAMLQMQKLKAAGDAAWTTVAANLIPPLTDLQTQMGSVSTACATAVATLNQLIPPLDEELTSLNAALAAAIHQAATGGEAAIRTAVDDYVQQYLVIPVTGPVTWIDQWITDQEAWIEGSASDLCGAIAQDIDALKNGIATLVSQKMNDVLTSYAGDVEQFRAGVQQIGQQIQGQLRQVAQGLTEEAATVATGATGAALRLIRAFGEPPQVPTMSFKVPIGLPSIDLPSMAYRFTDAVPQVDMTPARAVAEQVAEGLNGLSHLGFSVPTSSLLDRLLPDSLQNYDLRDILPKFAGIDLSQLFSGIRMPEVSNDTVRVTHHVDPQTRRASLDADIHVPLAGESSILSLGPVELRLVDAEFTAQVHCEVAVGEQVRQSSSGEITGDWELLIGGMPIVSFLSTTLSFDSSGNLHFSIKPVNVRLTEVLQFLADIVNSFTFGDSGFSIHMNPNPLSVQCILDLPLPDMSAGAFGIQNLRFGALFEIGLDGPDFYMCVGANLAKQTAPFILTIFVLGGAGWMEASMRYQKGAVTGEITIGMAASAALAISLGPISGSVSIQFGIFVEYALGLGGGLQLGIMILIVGRVSLLGIVDANITLLLEAQYSSGGGLVGRGVVSVSIKICWCFTLSVHASVQFTFGSAGGKSQPAMARSAARVALDSPAAAPPDPYDRYRAGAIRYVQMLA